VRIVSLLPSATEIIAALGLRDELVGVTHECDWPRDVAALPKVTRTLIPADATSREIDGLVRDRLRTQRALYTLDTAALERLRPDLIVTQSLCDVCAVADEEVQAAACSLPGSPRVVKLEPATLGDVLASMRQVAQAVGRPALAEDVVARLQARVEVVARRSERIASCPRVLLLEWIDPPFSCGHWSPELVRLAGGVEGLGEEGRPSRAIRWQEVLAWRPEVLIIACCGYSIERTMVDLPILQAYEGWSDLPCTRSSRVFVVNGSDYFSRPGPRLVDSLEILAHALDPSVHPLRANLPRAIQVRP
jgi:iron complex transport system substrate-binding protein